MRVGRALAGFVLLGAVVGSQLYANPLHPHAVLDGSKQAVAPLGSIASLTPAEMRVQGEQLRTKIAAHVSRASQAQAVARSTKDTLKVSCLAADLSVSRQLQSVADDSMRALDLAIRTGDRSAQVTHFKRIADAASECEQNPGAEGCAGAKEINLTKDTKTEVKKPKSADDPTDDCNILGLHDCVMQPLEYVGYASPFAPD